MIKRTIPSGHRVPTDSGAWRIKNLPARQDGYRATLSFQRPSTPNVILLGGLSDVRLAPLRYMRSSDRLLVQLLEDQVVIHSYSYREGRGPEHDPLEGFPHMLELARVTYDTSFNVYIRRMRSQTLYMIDQQIVAEVPTRIAPQPVQIVCPAMAYNLRDGDVAKSDITWLEG